MVPTSASGLARRCTTARCCREASSGRDSLARILPYLLIYSGNRMRWSSIFVYLSLLFVGIWLALSEYLYMPVVYDPAALGLSLVLVLAGFIGSALAWWHLLRIYAHPVPFRVALASSGLTIFGKYIPGKLWALVGRAGYIAEHSTHPLTAMSALSVTGQIIAIWLGLLLGGLTLLAGAAPMTLVWTMLALWGLLSAVLLSDLVHRGALAIARRMHLRLPTLPRLELRRLIGVLPPFVLTWMCWILGFGLFASALTGAPLQLADGLAFALAATVGIMAVIAPGGLGVREGLLVVLLASLGHSAADATMVAVHSRLWFLAGELGIFITGWWAGRPSRSCRGHESR